MTNDILTSLLKSTAALCALLLVGIFLRAKVPIFRKLLIPASILGGFVGLLFGPQVMGDVAVFRFPEEWINTWSLLTGILVVPMFAAVPLGNFKKNNLKGTSSRKEIGRIAMFSGITEAAFSIQIVFGVGLAMLLAKVLPGIDFYECFGIEFSQGFNGGHSMAGMIGQTMLDGGSSYWETAQGITTTFATIGLIGGIVTGILHINRGAKRGMTTILKDTAELPTSSTYGYTKNVEEQKSLGRETTTSSAIDTIMLHLAIILVDCGIAYWFRGLMTNLNVIGFKEVPVWSYALVFMYGINYLIKKLHLEWIIDSNVKNHITGVCTDLCIVAAVASMNVRAVMTYMLPIVIISILGFVLVYFTTIKICQRMMPNDCPFEHGILIYGINTGVMTTGVTLLKVCDSEFQTNALTDYSLSYAFRTAFQVIGFPILLAILANGSSMDMIVFGVAYVLIACALAGVGKMLYQSKKE